MNNINSFNYNHLSYQGLSTAPDSYIIDFAHHTPAKPIAELFDQSIDLSVSEAPIKPKDADLVALEEGRFPKQAIPNMGESALKADSIFSEKTINFATDLKTYDSALKSLAGTCKLCHLEGTADHVKQVRKIVKYVLGVKAINNGEINYKLKDLTQGARERKSVIGSLFTTAGIISDTAHIIQWLNIPGYNDLLEKSLAGLAMNVVDNTIMPLKFMYKLSSFDTAVRERIAFKGSPEAAHMKNIAVLKSGIEVSRELTKFVVLAAGVSNPIIPTALAAGGVVSGGLGLYLNYNSTPKKQKESVSATESMV
jgi:hypothetical protein